MRAEDVAGGGEDALEDWEDGGAEREDAWREQEDASQVLEDRSCGSRVRGGRCQVGDRAAGGECFT